MGGNAPIRDTPFSTPAVALHFPADIPFQALLDAAPDAIVIVDTAGRVVVVNDQVEHLFGYPRAELLGQPIEVLLPDQLHTLHVQHRSAYVAAPRTRSMGSGLNLAARRKDGSTFPVEISLSALATSTGLLVTSAIRDITDRKRAEEQFRALLESAPDAMVIVDRAGIVVQRETDGRPGVVLEINTDITDRKRAADALEQQVQQRTAHLNTLLQFSQVLLTARSLDTVLDQALRHAMALVPAAQRGAIYLHEPAGEHLALRASVGFRELPDFSRPLDLGLIGRAFQSHHVQQIDSVAQWTALIWAQPPDMPERLLSALRLEHPPAARSRSRSWPAARRLVCCSCSAHWAQGRSPPRRVEPWKGWPTWRPRPSLKRGAAVP